MKRTTALLGVLALLLFLVLPAAGNHDQFHAACLQKLTRIDAAYHGSGTWKQRANNMHTRLHEASVCYQEPAVPPPPAPPPPPVPPPPPPPPPVPQGENLPAIYALGALDVGLEYWVATDGNDTTGDGSEGNPWATPQKAADFLRLTATWPTDQDVVVWFEDGDYQATGGQTLSLNFTSGARSPNANRHLIFKAVNGYPNVRFENPEGTDQPKYSVNILNNTGNNFISFDGIWLWGGDTEKGDSSNGSSVGLYNQGSNSAADRGQNIEFVRGGISHFRAVGGSAQGSQTEGDEINNSVFAFNRIHDIGTTSDTITNQEHGGYLQGSNALILNNLFYNIVNGYDFQFFSGNAGNGSIVAHNTFTGTYASGLIVNATKAYTIKNNISHGHTGRGSSSYAYEFFPTTSGGAGVVDFLVHFGNQNGEKNATPASWTFGSRQNADPDFVDAASDDYHIESTSPARGYSDTTYSPAVDLDGNARPAGDEDAGAYQFTAGSPRTWVWR